LESVEREGLFHFGVGRDEDVGEGGYDEEELEGPQDRTHRSGLSRRAEMRFGLRCVVIIRTGGGTG
jgi:hypothetical protein